MTEHPGRRIPADSFPVRLAIVRAEMGWNYDDAEAATGVGSESWRTWEKGIRRCSDVIGVSRKIADATGYDQTWLALGGPLSEATPLPPRGRRKTARQATVITEGRSSFSREYASAPRPGRSAVMRDMASVRDRCYRFEGNALASITDEVAA
jgi:hypothetical protein